MGTGQVGTGQKGTGQVDAGQMGTGRVSTGQVGAELEDGLRARWLRAVRQPEVVFITLGPVGLAALEAAKDEPRWAVLDARSLQPLDTAAIREAALCGRLVTVEEGTTHGGLGGAVLELLAREDLPCRVRTLGLPDRFIRHGDARAQRRALGLDAQGLRDVAREVLR